MLAKVLPECKNLTSLRRDGMHCNCQIRKVAGLADQRQRLLTLVSQTTVGHLPYLAVAGQAHSSEVTELAFKPSISALMPSMVNVPRLN